MKLTKMCSKLLVGVTVSAVWQCLGTFATTNSCNACLSIIFLILSYSIYSLMCTICFYMVILLLNSCRCAVESTTLVKDTNATVYNAIKITLVILVMEFSFHSLNDTVTGQWWWQLITLQCQQQFLGIWAAVLQSILACSSSGGKKRAT